MLLRTRGSPRGDVDSLDLVVGIIAHKECRAIGRERQSRRSKETRGGADAAHRSGSGTGVVWVGG